MRVASVITLMVVLIAGLWPSNPVWAQICIAETAIEVKGLPDGNVDVCADHTLTYTIEARDCDETGDPYCYWDGVSLTFSGFSCSEEQAGGGGSFRIWKCTKTFNCGDSGTYEAQVDDSGSCSGGKDDPWKSSFKVTVNGVGSITGPDELCIEEEGEFTAQLCAGSEYCDEVTWNGGSAGANGCQRKFSFGSPGTYTVTASHAGCSASIQVTVPEPPPCPEDSDCDGDNGQGCSGGEGPSVGTKGPSVSTPAFGGGGGPGGDASNSGEGTCKQLVLEEIYSCANYTKFAFWDCDGKVTCFESTERPQTINFGGGWSATINSDGTYTVTSPDGSSIAYGGGSIGLLGLSGLSGSSGLMGPSSVTDPQGNITTYARDQNGHLESVTLPNGDVWNYETDGEGRITEAVAPGGKTTRGGYVQQGQNGEGKLQYVRVYEDENSLTPISEQTYSYDSSGRLEYYTKDGKTVQYEYGTNNNNPTITVTELSVTPQTKTIYEYGESTTTVTRKKDPTDPDPDADDQVTVYTYYLDSGKKTYLYQVTDALSNTTTYDVELSDPVLKGQVLSVTDGLGRETTHEYYEPGTEIKTVLLKRVSLPEVDSITYFTEYTYVYRDNQYWPYVETEVKGEKEGQTETIYSATKYFYNADWTLQKVQDGPNQNSLIDARTFTYYTSGAKNGMLETETIPNVGDGDKVTTYDYVDTGNKIRMSPTVITYEWYNPVTSQYVNKSIVRSYDDAGRQISDTDALSNTTTTAYAYDGNNNLVVTTTFPLTLPDQSQRTRVQKSACCGIFEEEDENGNSTYYDHAGGRLAGMKTDIQGANDYLVEYAYDTFGNTSVVTTWKDANTSRQTEYGYDKINRVVSIDHPGSLGTEEYQYDAVGNLIGKKDGNGDVTAYAYDDLNRVVKVDYDHGSWPVTTITTADVEHSYYKATSLPLTTVEVVGTSSYDYDYRGRMTSYTPPLPQNYGSITYTYDNANNKTSVSAGAGTTYSYYRNGWLKELEIGDGDAVIEYEYDAAGNRTKMERTLSAYPSLYFNTETEYDTRSRIASINHYDDFLNVAQVDYTRDGVGSPLTADWELDALTWDVSYGYDEMNRLTSENHSINGNRSWTYDWVGNRLDNGFAYNAQTDQLTEAPSGTTRQYYGTGSMSSKGQTTYTYNAQELLNEVSGGRSYEWDAANRRLNMTLGNDEYSFVYDPTASIPAVVLEVGPDGTAEYYREPDGSLVARIMPESGYGDEMQFYHFDALGNTVLLTRPDGDYGFGRLHQTYYYGAWGETYFYGSPDDNPYQYVGQLGYYTHYQDATLGMLQLGVRFYEPGTGRFGQRDAEYRLEPDWSAYLYGANNPILFVDPEGLYPNRESPETKWLRKCKAECVSTNTVPTPWEIPAIGAGVAVIKKCPPVAAFCIGITVLYQGCAEDMKRCCNDFCYERLENAKRRNEGKMPPSTYPPYDHDDYNGYHDKIWIPREVAKYCENNALNPWIPHY